MHDVFAAPRRRSHQHHSAKTCRSIQRHLLGDHSAERVAQDVAAVDLQRIEKGKRMLCHAGDRCRNCTRGSSDACVLKKDYLSSPRQGIGDSRVPVVECASEVLQAKKRQAWSVAEAAIGVALPADFDKSGGRRDVA
jgi:hypothetical protein